MTGVSDSGGGCVLAIHVVPRASRTEFAGVHGDRVKVRLQAPPVDGKANRVLLRFLAESLGVPAAALALLSGETGRDKRVQARGITAAEAAKRLGDHSVAVNARGL